jgi:hypothetical protein
MSSIWYFIAIWVRPNKLLREIKALLCNYLSSVCENIAKAHRSWDDCVVPKKDGGMVSASREDTMRALGSKWIIQAFIYN